MLAVGRRAVMRMAQAPTGGGGGGGFTLARRRGLQQQPQQRQSCRLSKPRRCGAKEGGKAEEDSVAVDVAYSGFLGWCATFPMRNPFMTNIVIATTKTACGDLVVQKSEGKAFFPKEGEEGIDWKRNAVFMAFGFAYLGAVQWFVYVTLFTKLCPNAIRFSRLSWADKLKDRAGQIDLVKQCVYDNFIHYTFMYFPVFYVFKEIIQAEKKQKEGEPLLTTKTFSDAMSRYWKNCVQDNLAMWSIWIPTDLLVYAAPMWLRLPLNHGVGFLWTLILSKLRGGES